MICLNAIRNDAPDSDRIFGLRPNQIAIRIKRAAHEAGCGKGFSGHSPRVGMTIDLSRSGMSLNQLMNAGGLEVTDDAGALHQERGGEARSGGRLLQTATGVRLSRDRGVLLHTAEECVLYTDGRSVQRSQSRPDERVSESRWRGKLQLSTAGF